MSGAVNWEQPLFPEPLIPQILRILLRSLAGFEKTHPIEFETDLSRRLLARMKRDAEIRDAPFYPYREIVEDDEESGRENRFDIWFILLDPVPKPPPYFVVEAKRLHVSFESGWSSLVAQYVTGKQGMMCFVDGRYSKGLTSAAMLGYVFDGNVQKARDGISKQVRKHHMKLKCRNSNGLKASRLGIPQVDETLHDFDGRHFTLFHILSTV